MPGYIAHCITAIRIIAGTGNAFANVDQWSGNVAGSGQIGCPEFFTGFETDIVYLKHCVFECHREIHPEFTQIRPGAITFRQ